MTTQTVRPLRADDELRLRAEPFTYEQVGQTAVGPVAGYRWFEKSAVLRRRDFEQAAADVMRWQIQARSGLRVWTSDSPLRAGTVMFMRLGPGPLSLRIPCRVVYVIDEPDLRGFGYGTLPGHPETGEERFELRRLPGGELSVTISAFSRPDTMIAKAGGPVSRRVQDYMTDRYLRALDR
ncbi:hypothetical protein GOARA_011_00130 [Gordonia araii NBRC 100433]|uniref:DUF1990 domain-containing protein n=1 Tax=Gordonia araii NBRC 100433 TaxID=1073574 RepID=G7GXS2_9ACTN|nr:DUF1990 domain-containing protein [Gordonia araii]NNG98407.1 DUF1990 domain-containing protein [Gordonia araii NBRC 100433]GAB08397.1 hypothetical protein GOARA_011_00130 [Gordonia araii NBRC 100433]